MLRWRLVSVYTVCLFLVSSVVGIVYHTRYRRFHCLGRTWTSVAVVWSWFAWILSTCRAEILLRQKWCCNGALGDGWDAVFSPSPWSSQENSFCWRLRRRWFFLSLQSPLLGSKCNIRELFPQFLFCLVTCFVVVSTTIFTHWVAWVRFVRFANSKIFKRLKIKRSKIKTWI